MNKYHQTVFGINWSLVVCPNCFDIVDYYGMGHHIGFGNICNRCYKEHD